MPQCDVSILLHFLTSFDAYTASFFHFIILYCYNFVNNASEVSQLKDHLPRYTLRVPQELLDKLGYIADYEGRTKNKELEQLIKKRIAEFEAVHGKIDNGKTESD